MAVFFQIAELEDAFETLGFYHQSAGYLGGIFDGNNARTAMVATNGPADDTTTYIKSPTFSSSNLWVHAVHGGAPAGGAPSATKSFIRFLSGGTQRFRVFIPTVGSIQIDKWTGSAWSTLVSNNVPSSTIGVDAVLNRIDVNISISGSGTIRVYVNNTLHTAITGIDTTFGGAITVIDQVIFSLGPTAGSYYTTQALSELIGADWCTIGSKLVTKAPDANGNYAEWTNGDYTVVDEINVGSDYASSGTANQRVDWSLADFPATLSNEAVKSFQLSGTINRDVFGPQSANFYTRISGTDYNGSDLTLSINQRAERIFWENNPATSAGWTPTILNAATFGVRSRT